MSVSLFVVKLAENFVGKFVGRLALLLVIWATPGLAEVRHSVEINTATDEQLQSL